MKTHRITTRVFQAAMALRCSMLSLLILWPLTSAAQNIDFSAPCPNPDDTLPPISVGVPIASPISVGSINAPGSVTMEILSVSYFSSGIETSVCAPPSCTDSESVLGVDIEVSPLPSPPNSVNVNGTPNALLAGCEVRFTLRATSNAQQCDRSFNLPVERIAVDLAVVLDKSGSMSWAYDGSSSPPNGQSRWDGLQTGVGIMATELSLSGLVAGDSIGMRLFHGGVVTPNAPFNAGLIDMQANVAQLPVVANQLSPGGSTALGDGIIAARDILLAGDPSHTKAMIVFSDGVQNSGDQVKVVAPNAYTHSVGGQDLNGPGDEIDIHTISLGSSGHNPTLMQEIAAANGGEYLNSEAGAPADFTNYFSLHLNTILAGGSPQHIALVKDQFPPAGVDGQPAPPSSSQTFRVNKGVNQLQVTLIAPNEREPILVSLAKDGVELIQQAQMGSGRGYTTVAIDYPLSGGGSLDGEWRVSARLGTHPKNPTPYTMMMLVDDHLTDVDYHLGGTDLKVGQSIQPSVGLSWNGKVVNNATVQAIMLKPGDDINDLLATTDVDFNIPVNDPGSPDAAKLAVLMQDQAFLDKITASEQAVNLIFDSTDQRYKGNFGNLDVAGVYQMLFRLNADAPEHGRIVRFQRQSFNVRFPDIDLPSSNLSSGTNQQGQSIISLRPRASNGKYIGPGWGSVISLVSNVTVLEIVDHGDGSYEIVTDAPPSGEVSIKIDDEVVFEGDLATLSSCDGVDAGWVDRIICWLSAMGLPSWFIWLLLALLLLLAWLFKKK